MIVKLFREAECTPNEPTMPVRKWFGTINHTLELSYTIIGHIR